jgi:hypothetical protein
MTAWPDTRKRVGALIVTLCFAAAVFFIAKRPTTSYKNELICTNGFCLSAMVLPASFDALPQDLQNKALSDYSSESGLRYGFARDNDGQLFAKLGSKRDKTQFSAFQLIYAEMEKDGVSFEPLAAELFGARFADSQLGPACDVSKPGRMFKLNEKELRRCIRSAYLLQAAPEFNERTQKLFEGVTVEYANGTTGPLTLKRPGLTDADRKMVLSEVAKIDAKARSLGGFR